MSKSNTPFYIPTDDCSAEYMFFASRPRLIEEPSKLVTADDLKKKNINPDDVVLPIEIPKAKK
jgi:hypothetical protein